MLVKKILNFKFSVRKIRGNNIFHVPSYTDQTWKALRKTIKDFFSKCDQIRSYIY